MHRRLRIFSAILFLTHATTLYADEMDEFQQAQRSAHHWLDRVDKANYDLSWQEAAEPLKKAVTSDQWKASIAKVRAPLGKMISRQPILVKYTQTLPNAPTGEYVVVQYETRFSNQQTAVETVTPRREQDGQWRVSGYFIKDIRKQKATKVDHEAM